MNSSNFSNNTHDQSFPDRIILVGFMGSGKSTVGKLLAEKLGYTYLDTDHEIEKKTGKTITAIFADSGENYFRSLESTCIKELYDLKKVVISTGGGLPVFNQNMALLNQLGHTVYLKTGINTIYKRIKNDKRRPLVVQQSPSELKKFIANKLSDRSCFYKQSLTFVSGSREASKIVLTILSKIVFKKGI